MGGARLGFRPGAARAVFGAGYADQAHMTREFHDLTGYTPKHLLTHASADVGRWMDERE